MITPGMPASPAQIRLNTLTGRKTPVTAPVMLTAASAAPPESMEQNTDRTGVWLRARVPSRASEAAHRMQMVNAAEAIPYPSPPPVSSPLGTGAG